MTSKAVLIDTHFHLLAIERKGVDVAQLLAEMGEAGIEGIDIGLDSDDLSLRIERFGKVAGVHFAAGIGPWALAEGQPPIQTHYARLDSVLSTHRPIAIGEIGLDNHWGYATQPEQERLLEEQIDRAEQMGLGVIIHNREADDQFIRLLKRRRFSKRGIFHCYQGDKELAHLAVDSGFFLSFAGPLTYKANKTMQSLFAALPLSSLLLETDSPYLAPVPLRGTVNTPLSMPHIYRYAAALRSMEEERFSAAIEANYRVFLAQRS